MTSKIDLVKERRVSQLVSSVYYPVQVCAADRVMGLVVCNVVQN